MLKSYILIAVRNIVRNKLYAAINVIGLAMGLSIYLFGGLFADYEYSHDTFFKNHQRIYSIGSIFTSEIDVGVSQLDGTVLAVKPILKSEFPDIEFIARTFYREFLFTIGEDNYYQKLRFADPELLDIFNFKFIMGDCSVLENPTNVVITEGMAKKYFGDKNPIGNTLTLDHKNDFVIGAVVGDLPANTHFNSELLENVPFEIIASMTVMERITGINPDEDWDNLSPSNHTYVMLPESLDQAWLQQQVDGVFERHFDEKQKKMIASLFVIPIVELNTSVWNSIGIPVIDVIELLGLFVLVITCLNYTNLATAQSMKRAKEVGLRKTLGAGQLQLLSQFIVESLMVTLLAMVLALSVLEFIIPLFNSATGKMLDIDYMSIFPWMLSTTLIVGVISGGYPAYLITKTNPIDALRDTGLKGRVSMWGRGVMIGIQFTISVFMLALVFVVYAQNQKVAESSNVFPIDKIYTLDRLGGEQLAGRYELLRNELCDINNVEKVSFSSHIPYHRNGQNMGEVSTIIDDFSSSFAINKWSIDQNFLKTYGMPLVAGRELSRDVALDTEKEGRKIVNVLVNEFGAQDLGFRSPEDAVGSSFYEKRNERDIMTYMIVGVLKDQNYDGFQNNIKPYVMSIRPMEYNLASLRLSNGASEKTMLEIKETWRRIVPDFPMQGRLLNEIFQENFELFKLASTSLAVFSVFAFFLALMGLYGLAAYMAEQRTKEIGVRKVHGATSPQIIELLIWQFSKPVIWAIPIALVFAYLASNEYLNLFQDRINLPYGSLVGAGVIGLLLSWLTVAVHAYNVARANPIKALHCE